MAREIRRWERGGRQLRLRHDHGGDRKDGRGKGCRARQLRAIGRLVPELAMVVARQIVRRLLGVATPGFECRRRSRLRHVRLEPDLAGMRDARQLREDERNDEEGV